MRGNKLPASFLLVALAVTILLTSCQGTSTPNTSSTPSAELTTTTDAEFDVTSLQILPAEVLPDEAVEIRALVTNRGNKGGVFFATVNVDGSAVASKQLELCAGASDELTFFYSTEVVGTHLIQLGDLSATFTVLKPPEPAEISVQNNRIILDFPRSITFALEFSSALPLKKVVLEYGTDKRTIASEVQRAEPEFGIGNNFKTSWTWDMRKTGSLPPGASVWWQWHITDEANREYTTQRERGIFTDARYIWQLQEATDMNLYWHGLGTNLIGELTEGVESKLARIELAVDIPAERKPKVFVYPDTEELKSAMLFPQEWTGAVAYPAFNIVLIPVTSSNLDWAKRTLAHEITHLLVYEAIFGPFGDIPTWLNEGLAQYAEGEMEAYHRHLLDEAIAEEQLTQLTLKKPPWLMLRV
jgi:hypothetical protein